MVTIPISDVFGWLFRIDSNDVKGKVNQFKKPYAFFWGQSQKLKNKKKLGPIAELCTTAEQYRIQPQCRITPPIVW